MIWIGIDPGLRTGAIGAIDHNSKFIGAYDIQAIDDRIDSRALKQLILDLTLSGDDYAICIEQVGVMPKQGLVSSGRFMRAFGSICSVAELTANVVHFVIPRVWKKSMNLNSEKDRSLEAARIMFPEAKLLLKKDHGKAEALLIAEYARKKFS